MRYLITALLFIGFIGAAEAQVYPDPEDTADVGAGSRYRLDPTVVTGSDSNTAVVGRRYYYPYYDPYYGYGYQRGVTAVPSADDPNYFPPEAASLGTQAPTAPAKKTPAKTY